MTTVICICRVADYDRWRPGYDEALEAVAEHLRGWRLWRGQDDHNLIVIEETFANREVAVAAWESPETKVAMEADGIDMSSLRFEYVDEVESG